MMSNLDSFNVSISGSVNKSSGALHVSRFHLCSLLQQVLDDKDVVVDGSKHQRSLIIIVLTVDFRSVLKQLKPMHSVIEYF